MDRNEEFLQWCLSYAGRERDAGYHPLYSGGLRWDDRIRALRILASQNKGRVAADVLELLLPPEVRVCNCAECGTLMAGGNQVWFYSMTSLKSAVWLPYVAGYIKGRPYCPLCLIVRPRKYVKRCKSRMYLFADGGGIHDNAVRAMEDG